MLRFRIPSKNAQYRSAAQLNSAGDDLEWHLLAVQRPVLLVLVFAALIVPPSSIEEQDGEVHRVEEGQRVLEQRRDAPEEGGGDLWDVVEVSAS